jgi:hypothetical protein
MALGVRVVIRRRFRVGADHLNLLGVDTMFHGGMKPGSVSSASVYFDPVI